VKYSFVQKIVFAANVLRAKHLPLTEGKLR